MSRVNQEFNIVGITNFKKKDKIHFGVDMVRRVKQFYNAGATRVDMIQLPKPMLRMEALLTLKSDPNFQSPADQALIDEAIFNRTPKTPKTPKAKKEATVKVKVKAGKTKPSIENIKKRAKKAEVAETETQAS